MTWSGGTFSRVHDWTTDEGAGTDIEASRMDAEDDNFRDGINACIHKAGQNTATGDLPMGGNKHTAVGNAAALDQYASATDVIDQGLTYYVDTGTGDAYVITPSPAITAYAEGQRFTFRALAANTTGATLNVNALGAVAIETMDGNALLTNMIIVGGYYEVTYDANGSRFVLTSPNSLSQVLSTTDMIAGTGLTGGGTLASDRTFNVIGGTGITANANDIATDDSAIVHDNLSGFVADEHVAHSGVTVTAGTGMTGGGTIDATITLNVIGGAGLVANADDMAVGAGNGITVNANDVALTDAAATASNPVDVSSGTISLDIDSLTTIEGNALAATDTFYVEDGGVSKGIEVQDMGLRVQTGQTTQTLAATDMNSIMEFTGVSTLTLPLNATTALPLGVPVVLNVKHATEVLTVTADTSVTLVSVYHPAGAAAESDSVDAGGTALLYKTAANVWVLSGDISD